MILRHLLINSIVGRYFGAYHRRVPASLSYIDRALTAYVNDCRLRAGARIFAQTVVHGLSEAAPESSDVQAMTRTLAGQFPGGNVSVAVDFIAAQAAIGRLCIAVLQELDVADWRPRYAPLLRRVLALGLGMKLGQTNDSIKTAGNVLIEMESLRFADPATFDTWDKERRRLLAGVIVGDAMAADFLGQHRIGAKSPKPSPQIDTLFYDYIMFERAEISTKGTALPLRPKSDGPGMTSPSPQ